MRLFQIIGDCFQGRIVSSAYLTGDGFDGGWMKRSVSLLCQGRRAFMGKNLYSKGACYAAAVLDGQQEWRYVSRGQRDEGECQPEGTAEGCDGILYPDQRGGELV